MERSMRLNLNDSIWEDSEETLRQECMHRGNHNSTEITVDSHGEDHNLHTKSKQYLFDLNEIYNDEMETMLSENFCTVNRIDQEVRNLPPIVGCPNELIMSQESNTEHHESSMICRELSDLESKITAVSLGSTVYLDLDKEEGYGDSQTTVHNVSSEDRKGKFPMSCDPPNSPHYELVSEEPNYPKSSTIRESSPPIIIDLSSDTPSSSECDLAALSGVTQALETEQDSHSPMQVAKPKPNPILPCIIRSNATQRRSHRRSVPYSRRELAPAVPGPNSLYGFVAKPVKDVDYLSSENIGRRRTGKEPGSH